ncbi:30101_t:CDS:1, partial [Racocetra persica]
IADDCEQVLVGIAGEDDDCKRVVLVGISEKNRLEGLAVGKLLSEG